MELQDVIDDEQELFDKLNTTEFREFIANNRVEVHFESDWQYACYINYTKGERSWGGSVRNPLLAMAIGVKQYLKHADNSK